MPSANTRSVQYPIRRDGRVDIVAIGNARCEMTSGLKDLAWMRRDARRYAMSRLWLRAIDAVARDLDRQAARAGLPPLPGDHHYIRVTRRIEDGILSVFAESFSAQALPRSRWPRSFTLLHRAARDVDRPANWGLSMREFFELIARGD